TSAGCPSKTYRGLGRASPSSPGRVGVFHTYTLPPRPLLPPKMPPTSPLSPQATHLPSGENATAHTSVIDSSEWASSFPVAGDHSRSVLSRPAEASTRPFGENATASAPPECSPRTRPSRSRVGSQIRTLPSAPPAASGLPSGAK